jgi:xanthine dehydrogenase iron-sulfur cluster and FAD-binding subunit A
MTELVRLRAAHPQACLLAGGTDIGLWVTKQFRELGNIIYLGHVEELRSVTEKMMFWRSAPQSRSTMRIVRCVNTIRRN